MKPVSADTTPAPMQSQTKGSSGVPTQAQTAELAAVTMALKAEKQTPVPMPPHSEH